MNQTYDLVIIGGGSAGLTAAAFAIQLGARVALVEKQKRQKRKRSKKAKEKMLENKRIQSQKKQDRRRIADW